MQSTTMNMQGPGMRPRVQSARRSGADASSITPMMGATQSTQMMPGQQSMDGMQMIQEGMHGNMKLQRPTKSAANKYRHMIHGGGAIAEEIDYVGSSNQNIVIGGLLHSRQGTQGVNGLKTTDDMESFGSTAFMHPSGMQIHRAERRSAVRLKHHDERPQGSSYLNKTTQHTVSHGAGVLLGNLNYGEEGTFIRDLNVSNTSGNLKSVYDMRVSHSNLARQSKPPTGTKAKRKHLQSAITRSKKPNTLTGYDNNTFSHQNILPQK